MVRAVNKLIENGADFLPTLQENVEKVLGNGSSEEIAKIDSRLLELQKELLKRADARQDYSDLTDAIDELREEKDALMLTDARKKEVQQRMVDMVEFLQTEPDKITAYNEAIVRQMIEKITVYDEYFVVEFKSGVEITINE